MKNNSVVLIIQARMNSTRFPKKTICDLSGAPMIVRIIQRVKKSIISGEIGKIRIVSVTVRWCRPQRYYDLSKWRGTFSHDGGALTNQGIHHIDLIRYLGGEIKNLRGEIMRWHLEGDTGKFGKAKIEDIM